MKNLFTFILLALILVPAPSIIILGCNLQQFTLAIAPITACFTLLLGWAFNVRQTIDNFFKTETIKHKDKLISMVEDFFEEFLKKLSDRAISEQDLLNFTSDKISSIEFKHSIQEKIYGGKAITFISDETFAKLRMIWKIEHTDYKAYKRLTQEMKEEILQEIENNYITWLRPN